MARPTTAAVVLLCLAVAGCTASDRATSEPASTDPAPSAAAPGVALPQPQVDGDMAVERALSLRRSTRDFAGDPLELGDVGQLLWAAQGVTSASGGRTAPSAGGLHPLEVYLVAGAVAGLPPGMYRYRPGAGDLQLLGRGDLRADLAEAALGQAAITAAPASLVLAARPERTAAKYGDRADRFVALEAGHAAQNVYLQAAARGLGTVSIGSFGDDAVRSVLGLPDREVPMYVMPVGRTSPGR